jgi:ABC-type microcin C transport system duplicated ATPase subunit YejF
MREGKVVEQGDVEQVFNHPQSDYTRELASASLYHQSSSVI